MKHSQIWQAIDALAARHGLTPSGLARAAGLDPTTFNKSKRISADGKPRWPSTESLSRVLAAVGAGIDDFAALMLEAQPKPRSRPAPLVGMARAGVDGFFEDVELVSESRPAMAGHGAGRLYALEISGDSMEPVFRRGSIVMVHPTASVREGDRVVVRTHTGEVMAKELGRRNPETIELVSANPAYPPRRLAAREVDWMGRIVWASQ